MLLSSFERGTEEYDSAFARGFSWSELSLVAADDNNFAQLLNADI